MSDKLVTPLSDDESSWMWVWNGSEYKLIEDYNAVAKAQSFKGDRSAAGRYAAQVRWGNRGAKTEAPTLPDGWTVVDQITTREGTNHYELQGPRYADEGGTLTATISANSEESYVELNRVGGSKQGSIGQMRSERDEEYNIENGFPKTTHTIQNIGVEPSEQRKGYATLLLRIGRALSYNGLQIEHSPSLTEDGKGFSSAVKSEGLEKKKEGAKSFGGDRSAAGEYAARIRWGTVRLKDKVRWAGSVQPMDSSESDVMFTEMYDGNLPLELFTASELNEVYNGTIDTWYSDLRHGKKTGQVKKGVEAFDGVFSRALPLPRDIVVYRGVQSKRLKKVLKNIPVGASFKDKSYTCTTSELSIGRRFAGMEYYGKGETHHMLQITVRRGTKVLPMRQLVPHSSRFGMRVKENQGFQDQHYMHEFEVLLNRGAKFTVVGRELIKGTYDGEGWLPNLQITKVVLDG